MTEAGAMHDDRLQTIDALFSAGVVVASVCVGVEFIALLFDEMGMALLCRALILLVLYFTLSLRRHHVTELLKRRAKYVIHRLSFIGIVVAMETLGAQGLLLIFLGARIYILVVIALSVMLIAEECREVRWLFDRESALRETYEPDGDSEKAASEYEARWVTYARTVDWVRSRVMQGPQRMMETQPDDIV
jgi:hypothetical protein